ncbi:hypothetical protein NITHO_1720004 [Nitrolancea hollandica Lb]|uniref:Uncharacterized protein n=1 Tax=Nitrolancea hollandica Lb TaxID=1129897 RepID=I4EE52_9BACT|nr:hypothetical protein NITHO_1720004 [Nitrolancea hollandica Lb]
MNLPPPKIKGNHSPVIRRPCNTYGAAQAPPPPNPAALSCVAKTSLP